MRPGKVLRALVLALAFVVAAPFAIAQSDPAAPSNLPLISTDKLDYEPGDYAIISGSNFAPGEDVMLQIVHGDGTAEGGEGHDPWIVHAEADGTIWSVWYVNPDDSRGSLLRLTADSATGHAEMLFTDASTTVVINAVDTGWYNPAHSAGNKNYIVGRYAGDVYRDYFVFSLAGLSGTLQNAKLVASNGCANAAPNLTFYLFDVSTPISVLSSDQNLSNGASISNDLATGTQFGSALVANPSASAIEVTLNNFGVQAIRNNLGGQIAFGGSYPSGGGENYTLGCTWLQVQLVLTFAGAPNNVPVANSQSVNATEDTPKNITLTASDADNDPLTYTVDSTPANGTLTGAAPNLTYTPNHDYHGSDSFTFHASDGKAVSNVATVTINVASVPDDPAINWGTSTIVYGTALGAGQLNATATYGGNAIAGTFAYTATQNSTTYNPAAGAILSVSGTPSNATLNVTFTPSDLAEYTVQTKSVSISILKKPLSVTANDHQRSYGDANPTLDGNVVGALPADAISATYSTAANATSPVGPYAIVATLVDPNSRLANYDVTNNQGTLTITSRPVTVTADAKSKTYGDGDPALTYQITAGNLANGDTFSGALTRDPGENVNSYAIRQGTVTAGSNYTLTYVGANVTITRRPGTVTPDAKSKIYGEADPTLTGTLSGFLAADNVSATYSRLAGETVAGSPYTISATFSPNAALGNYTITYNTANFTITPKSASVTPEPASKVYGSDDPALTGSLSGFLAADNVSAMYSRVAGETVAGSPYTISGTLSSNAALGNYTITYNTASFTITQRLVTITADPKSKTYGADDPTLTYQITSGILVTGDTFSGSLTRTAGENVGSYAIQQGTLALSANYALTFVSANVTITPKNASVTPNAATKTYGDADPGFSGTLSGFLSADNVTATYSRTAGEAAGGTYVISATLSPAEVLGNYDITYNTAGFTIDKKTASVTPNGASKTYGDADPIFTGTLSGFLPSDNVTATYSRTAGEAAGGTYTISATLSPAGVLGNYVITYDSAAFTITTRPVTVTADVKTKVYGDTGPTLTYHVTSGSLVGSDTFTGSLTRAEGENVGNYAIQQGTLALSANYALTYVGATLTITQRPVTVTADAKSKILGQSDPALTYQVTSGNLVNGDTFSGALTRAAGEGVGSYPIQQGTLALSANYALTYTGANLTISYASASQCGHVIQQPINTDGTSVFKKGSTVPAKFRVCDANGNSVGTPGVVSSFNLVQVINGTTVSTVTEDVYSTTPDAAFRWDATAQQWIFNINTKSLSAGQTYIYRISLNDGSYIFFQYGLK